MAKVQPVPDDAYAAQKKAVADRCVLAEVTGPVLSIRDAVTRESIGFGGAVSLDPETTNIDLLVNSGAVKLMPAKKTAAADAPVEG